MKKLLLVLILNCLIQLSSLGATYTLAIAVDLQSTNDIRAVHVLWGTVSRVYTSGVLFSNITSLAVTNTLPTTFQPQTTYYFVATAIDRWGQESAMSGETAYTTLTPPPPPPPSFRFVTNILQGAISPSGPWKDLAYGPVVIPITNSYGFIRGFLAVGN